MTTIGSTAIHLRIAKFKFTHNFIICDKLPNTKFIFGIDIQRKFSLSYAWDKDSNCYLQKSGTFLTYTHNSNQQATIGTVRSTLRIPPRHNGVIPIKITGPPIKEPTAYLIANDNTLKGRNPNINIISRLHRIKGKTTVNVLVSNYSNKHLTFHKGEYIGHVEPAILEDNSQNNTIETPEPSSTNSITLKKMMAETVTPDCFQPPMSQALQILTTSP